MASPGERDSVCSVERRPKWILYPGCINKAITLKCGEGLYLFPAFHAESIGFDDHSDETGFDEFLDIAHGLGSIFAGNPDLFKLDSHLCRELWDTMNPVPDNTRIHQASDELCTVMTQTPTTGFGDGFEDLDAIVWAQAREVMLARAASRCSTRGLRFRVDRPLPAGIDFGEKTGTVSGVASSVHSHTKYTVEAFSELGTAQCIIEIGVEPQCAPSDMCFRMVDRVYYAGHPISLVPTVSGVPTEWSITPDLPPNLVIDSDTGRIHGIPMEEFKETKFLVTATNDVGKATTHLIFCIVLSAPERLSYIPSVDAVASVDRRRSTLGVGGRRQSAALTLPLFRPAYLRPTVYGLVDFWSITPDLPEGLNLHPGVGMVYGIPSVPSEMTAYTIIASNRSGSTKASISFKIKEMAANSFSYPGLDDAYFVGEAVRIEPEVNGGATEWIVDPELPDGMQLDSVTGVISGCPKEARDEVSYVITASNDAGGTSTVVSFMVMPCYPTELVYEVPPCGFAVGDVISVEPGIDVTGMQPDFSVKPCLPEGLLFNRDTGVISGEILPGCESGVYSVSLRNAIGSTSCDMSLTVRPPAEVDQTPPMVASGTLKSSIDGADESFASALQDIGDLSSMPPQPSRTLERRKWLFWIAHRVWLGDPTLSTLNLSGQSLPLPESEPRITTKLFKALVADTSVKNLDLSSCSLNNVHATFLGEVLRNNTCLSMLNIDNNNFDSESMEILARSIKSNPRSALTTFFCKEMKGGTTDFGRNADKAMAEMMEENEKIVQMTYVCGDLHLKCIIDECLQKNADVFRRDFKAKAVLNGADQEKVEQPTATRYELVSFRLLEAPATDANLVFAGNNKFALLRGFIAEKSKLPTKEQLQMMATNKGMPLKYSEVAPLVKEFTQKWLDTSIGLQIEAVDATRKKHTGTLNRWREKNSRWSVGVLVGSDGVLPGGVHLMQCGKDPVIEVDAMVTKWVKPETTE